MKISLSPPSGKRWPFFLISAVLLLPFLATILSLLAPRVAFAASESYWMYAPTDSATLDAINTALTNDDVSNPALNNLFLAGTGSFWSNKQTTNNTVLFPYDSSTTSTYQQNSNDQTGYVFTGNYYCAPGFGTLDGWSGQSLITNATWRKNNGVTNYYEIKGLSFVASPLGAAQGGSSLTSNSFSITALTTVKTGSGGNTTINPVEPTVTDQNGKSVSATSKNVQSCLPNAWKGGHNTSGLLWTGPGVPNWNLISTAVAAYNNTNGGNGGSGGSGGGGGSGGSGGGGPNTPSCEETGFALSWIMCPIITGIADGADNLYKTFIQPLLVYKASDLSSNGPLYGVWSNFRVYADIFLVLALLVIVFSEAAGGGLIDAYSARKILPRLLAAVILINLSIYIVNFAVDVFNILGNGLASLIEDPFIAAGAKLHISPATDFTLLAILGTGVGTIWGLIHFGAAKLAGAILEIIGFSIIVPALFILAGIFGTLIIRRGIILFLVLSSPIAFVLYTMPNTEQYFRRWWNLFMRTLLIYPIISVAFGLGFVMSVTLGTATGFTGVISQIFALVALYLPLAFIPFSFRVAGGILGRVHEGVSNVTDRLNKAGFDRRREFARQNFASQSVQGRAAVYDRLHAAASRGSDSRRGRFRRATLGRVLKGTAGVIGGYNIEQSQSEVQAAATKEVRDIVANGPDDQIRGLLVDKAHALRTDKTGGSLWRMENGKRQFKTLAGKWVDEGNVDAAHSRWGGDAAHFQAALAYEMGKATTDEDIQSLTDNFDAVASGQGMKDYQKGGVWIGAAFANQNRNLAYKYMSKDGNGHMSVSPDKQEAFVQEIFNNRGSYNLAQMHGSTIQELIDVNRSARQRLLENPNDEHAQRMAQMSASVAETFVSRYGGAGGQLGGEDAAEQERQAAAAAAGAGATRVAGPQIQTMTPGAAHTASLVRQLAIETGQYQAPPNPQSSSNPADWQDIDPQN